MMRRFGLLLAVATAATFSAAPVSSGSSDSDLVVHEWGTFTSVAGDDGQALEWQPQAGVSDLPCFVDRLPFTSKGQLSGTVRMETPVLYFYARDRVTVDVRVRFPLGLVTEWFPRAAVTPSPSDAALYSSNRGRSKSAIEWRQATVAPGGPDDFPMDASPSHYYAARLTDAAPLAVGGQHEKFLFYRGVGRFAPPITAIVGGGGTVRIGNRATDPIPDALLFDQHDGSTTVQRQHGIAADAVFDAPLPADIAPVKGEIEQMLVANGLYPSEAAAMVATWGDSWFEEGTRLLYVLPRSAVDAILPLDVAPAPASTVRVFVGRAELMSDATLRTVKAALLSGDRAALARYGRFLQAFGERIISQSAPTERAPIERTLQNTFDLWGAPPTGCRATPARTADLARDYGSIGTRRTSAPTH